MKILFFTELSLFPANGGERIRSLGLVKALVELGYSVDVVMRNEDDEDVKSYSISGVKFFIYQCIKPTILERLLRFDHFVYNKEVISLFENLLIPNYPQVVILDFYKSSKYYRYFQKKGIPIVFSTHNVDSRLIAQRPCRSFKSFFGKNLDFLFLNFYERIVFKAGSAIWAVSQEDLEYYSKVLPDVNIFLIPNFLDETLYQINKQEQNYVAMTANFGVFMNFEGMKWLLTEVWDNELDQKVNLKLIGKHSKEAFENIKCSFRNVEAIGAVDDMLPYITNAKAVLVPLLHGGGTRLKCLEAMALSTLIISTSKGREGIVTEGIITVDKPSDFKNAILNSCDRANRGNVKIALDDFFKTYSLKANLINIQASLEKIVIR